MRRILAATTALPMKNKAVAGTSTSATTAAAAASAQLRSHTHSHSHNHSHSHGGGGHHHHSHAAIEKEIEGANLRSCQMATLAGGATNVFFCVTKLWVGSSGGSVALVADGFHALTDIVADVVSYASISLSKKKFPRCRFPFGIGRLETSGAVFVAAILLVGGVMLLVQSFQSCLSDLGEVVFPSAAAAATVAAAAAAGAVASHSDDGAAAEEHHHPHTGHGAHEEEAHGHSHAGGAAHGHSHFEVTQYDATTGKQVILWTMVTLAASSVVCKELLFHWTRRVGQRAGSRVVVANAYHHRADAWSGAVALVGVAGQMMGIPGVDGIAGLVVSLSICKIGYGLFRDSVLEFFDYQNAEEVSQVRERLQDFHLRVLGDGAVTAERNSPMAAAASPDVHESKIRYVNVFLMRHGHSYALHVKLLVHESQTAAQIQDAVAELEKLAKASLPVQETFIALMVCSPSTVTRGEYFQTLYKDTFGASPAPSEADEGEGSDDEHHDHHHTAPQRKRDGPADAETAKEMFIAAEGNLVNPSLEKVLRALSEFHGFTKPIRYRWETRTVVTPKDSSCECSRDVESVAKIFGCQLREAEGDDREECQHGHNHSHGHEHPAEEAEAEEGKKTQ